MVNKSALIFLIFIIFSCCPFTSHKLGEIYHYGKPYEEYKDFSGKELIETFRDIIYSNPQYIYPFDSTKKFNETRDYKNITLQKYNSLDTKGQIKLLLDSSGREFKEWISFYLPKYNLVCNVRVLRASSKRMDYKISINTKFMLNSIIYKDMLSLYAGCDTLVRISLNCEEQNRLEQVFEREIKTKLDSLLLVKYPGRIIG